VRGDSLRDLYAKSLALAGLGVLAALGALVDYWPADLGVPVHLAGPSYARPALSSDAARPSGSDWTMPVARNARATMTTSAPRLTLTDVSIAPAVPSIGTLIEPIAEQAVIPSLALAVGSDALLTSSAAAHVTLGPPPVAPDTAEPAPAAILDGPLVPLVAPVSNNSSSFAGATVDLLADAVKKTGQTIVKGGVKTGASIVDGFQALTGMLKKAPWFFDTKPTQH
jgi:hypothetical protein